MSNRQKRRSIGIVPTLLLVLALIGFALYRFGFPHHLNPNEVTLMRVSDGDTVVVKDAGGRQIKVRLIGVDAPELGTAASFRSALYAAELCEKAYTLRLEPEPTRPTDKYGRILGWVWLTMPDGRKLLLNSEMIHSGNAKLYEPTSRQVKYYNQLR